MIDYESPITQIVSDMQMGYENGVLKAVQNVGFHVNKEELTKALLYDREQYQKGYVDGLNADKWIPCSERLPNNTDNVLITTRYGVVLMVFLGMSKNWCYLNGKRITDSQDMPIAWQPLPTPYQKGE